MAGFARALAAALLASSVMAAAGGAHGAAGDLAIVGGTVIDVSHAGHASHDLADAVVIIRHGRIADVGTRGHVRIPAGAQVIDARGKYLTPGLIDGFGAMRSQRFADAYLYEGVTSVLVTRSPVGGDGEQTIVESIDGPRVLHGASIGGYSPIGEMPINVHPWTEHRLHDRRLTPAELTGAVDDAAVHGARSLFIGLDVWPEQLRVILAEARRRHLATVMEAAFTPETQAIDDGVGALVRADRYETALAPAASLAGYAEDPTGRGAGETFRWVCKTDLNGPEVAALGARLAASRTALMPALSIEATADDVGAPNPWLWRSSVFVQPSDLDDPVDSKTGDRPYLEAHPDRRDALQACAEHRQQIDAALHRRGAVYLAGSAAPSFGILPGGGLHQELKLLVRIGLTPREALAAATGNFAERWGWRDLGEIAPGRAGDVLILNRDPRADVAAVDDIAAVIHDGRVVDRAALVARAVGQASASSRLFAPESGWPPGSDASPAFTPDGRTVVFTHAVGAARTLMISHFEAGVWSKPTVAPFSGVWRDIEPAMAPDGSYLIFISNRPSAPGGEPLTGFWGGQPRPGAGGNIWRVDRHADGWGPPVRLPDVINSNGAIYSPAVAADGSVYFNQPDPVTHRSHIYRAQATRDGFRSPAPLPFSHGEVGDFDAAVAPDESFIVFSSGRSPAPADGAAIFIAFRRDGQWTPPRLLDPLTLGLEARLSPDLKTLYYSAESAGGGGDARIFERALSPG